MWVTVTYTQAVAADGLAAGQGFGDAFPLCSCSHRSRHCTRLEEAMASGHVPTMEAFQQTRFPGQLSLTSPQSEPHHTSPLSAREAREGRVLAGGPIAIQTKRSFVSKEKWPNNSWVGCQQPLIYRINPLNCGQKATGNPIPSPDMQENFFQETCDSPSWLLCFPVCLPVVLLVLTLFQLRMATSAQRSPHDLSTQLLWRTRAICVFTPKFGKKSDY